jgi:anti-anti-sigma factor
VAVSVVVFPVVGPVFDLVGESNSRGLVWAWLRCDLDVATASGARVELTGLLGGLDGPDVVVVYIGFERFVDLRGVRVLVEVAMSLRDRGGEMVLVAPPRCLQMIVELTGVGSELTLAATPWHATEWLKRRAARPITHDGHNNHHG